jgi:hypothetical protein
MSKDQLKFEINKLLDHYSNDTLQDLLMLLRKLEEKRSASIDFALLEQILAEDKGLLEKLAQ